MMNLRLFALKQIKPTKNKSTPLASLKANKVMPNSLKMILPIKLNKAMIIKAINTALKAVFFRSDWARFAVNPTKTGVFAIGFIMAKKNIKVVKAKSISWCIA
jgi:hypothetical protein